MSKATPDLPHKITTIDNLWWAILYIFVASWEYCIKQVNKNDISLQHKNTIKDAFTRTSINNSATQVDEVTLEELPQILHPIQECHWRE